MDGAADTKVRRVPGDPPPERTGRPPQRHDHRPPGQRQVPDPLVDRRVCTALARVVPCLSGGASLADALEAFAFASSRHLVVVDRLGRCLGVLSDRLVAAAWARDPFGLHMWKVADLVGPVVPAVGPNSSIGHAATLMSELGVDAVAVVQEGRPIGVLTAADLVDLLAREAWRRHAER